MNRPHAFRNALLILTMMTAAVTGAEDAAKKVDVCIYGATPAGIVAAVAAKQEGCTVLIIEPSRWLGGILGAGLKPMQDCPEPAAVGGLTASRIFTMRKRPDLLREDFAALIKSEQIPVIFEHRLQRVEKTGPAITQLVLEQAPPDG